MGGSSSTPTTTTTTGWMPEQEMLSQQFSRYLMGLNVVPPATPTTQPTQGTPYIPSYPIDTDTQAITQAGLQDISTPYTQASTTPSTPSPIDQYISEMQGEGYKPLWQQPATGYTGQMTAGWQPEQERALTQYQEAYAPLSAIAAGPSSPEYQKQMDIMAAPLRRILTEQMLPAMREQYGAQGLGLSTPLMQQELQSRTGVEENIAAAMQQRQMQALQQMPQVTQAYAAQAGAKQTAEQTALTNKYNEWLRTRPEYSPWLQTLMTYLGKTPKETIVTT